MSGEVFKETLRRNWRQIAYWGSGLALLALYIVLVIPDVDALKNYAKMAESLPPALLKMFGAEDAAALATPEGFINFGYFGYTLLLLAVYAVIAGLGVTANEEDAGILDVHLSLPVARRQIVLEKLAAYMLIMICIIGVGSLGLLIGSQTSELLKGMNMTRIVEATLNMIPSALLMISVTTFLAALVRRKSTATAIAAVFIIGSYFVDFISEAASESAISGVRVISFFSYYDTQGVIQNGLNVGNIAVLLIATVLLVAGTVWAFQKRDVGI